MLAPSGDDSKALVPAMMDRGWGRGCQHYLAIPTAPIGVLGSAKLCPYRSDPACFAGTFAFRSRAKGVTINNLLRGIHATEPRRFALEWGVGQQKGIHAEEARTERASTIPAGRYGTTLHEFGRLRVFLCRTHAGLIDGGPVTSTGCSTTVGA